MNCASPSARWDTRGARSRALSRRRSPHPVQMAMAEADATQAASVRRVSSCRASLAARRRTARSRDHPRRPWPATACAVRYRPIVAAMTRVAGLAQSSRRRPSRRDRSVSLTACSYAPRLHWRVGLVARRASGSFVAGGGNRSGLLASWSRRPPGSVIHVAHVPELHGDYGGTRNSSRSALPRLMRAPCLPRDRELFRCS